MLAASGWRNAHGKHQNIAEVQTKEPARRLLYTTEHDGRDTPGLAVRFTMPSVANGRVYVVSRVAVYVFGLLHPRGARRVPAVGTLRCLRSL